MIQADTYIVIKEARVPVFLHEENRRGYRASFTKKGVNIRIPKSYNTLKKKELFQQLINWAEVTLQKKPKLASRYKKHHFFEGATVQTFDKIWTVTIRHENRKTIGSSIQNDNIIIHLPNEKSSDDILPQHISKALKKYYKSFFARRTLFWNQLFPIQMKSLRLKYNSSNWGSCSAKKNINLSTRLFLCPLPVIDYVIVHELAHLIQPNHSKSFWAEVAHILPDYKVHERWLKTKGAYLDF